MKLNKIAPKNMKNVNYWPSLAWNVKTFIFLVDSIPKCTFISFWFFLKLHFSCVFIESATPIILSSWFLFCYENVNKSKKKKHFWQFCQMFDISNL